MASRWPLFSDGVVHASYGCYHTEDWKWYGNKTYVWSLLCNVNVPARPVSRVLEDLGPASLREVTCLMCLAKLLGSS